MHDRKKCTLPGYLSVSLGKGGRHLWSLDKYVVDWSVSATKEESIQKTETYPIMECFDYGKWIVITEAFCCTLTGKTKIVEKGYSSEGILYFICKR